MLDSVLPELEVLQEKENNTMADFANAARNGADRTATIMEAKA